LFPFIYYLIFTLYNLNFNSSNCLKKIFFIFSGINSASRKRIISSFSDATIKIAFIENSEQLEVANALTKSGMNF